MHLIPSYTFCKILRILLWNLRLLLWYYVQPHCHRRVANLEYGADLRLRGPRSDLKAISPCIRRTRNLRSSGGCKYRSSCTCPLCCTEMRCTNLDCGWKWWGKRWWFVSVWGSCEYMHVRETARFLRKLTFSWKSLTILRVYFNRWITSCKITKLEKIW